VTPSKGNKNASKLDRQIVGLPTGWVWSNDPWVNSRGQQSTARHGHWVGDGRVVRKGNRDLSLREVQNRQKQTNAKLGIVKPASKRKTGRIRTIKYNPEKPKEILNPERRGQAQYWTFYTLAEARSFVGLQGIPLKYLNVLIQVNYTKKIVDTSKTGSDTKVGKRNGWATLTPFREAAIYNDGAVTNDAKIQIFDNPWIQAETNIQNFDMSGSKARVYVYMAERSAGGTK
jgi:hypothetical protein